MHSPVLDKTFQAGISARPVGETRAAILSQIASCLDRCTDEEAEGALTRFGAKLQRSRLGFEAAKSKVCTIETEIEVGETFLRARFKGEFVRDSSAKTTWKKTRPLRMQSGRCRTRVRNNNGANNNLSKTNPSMRARHRQPKRKRGDHRQLLREQCNRKTGNNAEF